MRLFRKTQTVSQKVCGFYQRNIQERKLESFLELIENKCTSTNISLELMTKMDFKGGIKANNIENLRTMALRLMFSVKKSTIDYVTHLVECPGLLEYFPHVMINGYLDVTQAK